MPTRITRVQAVAARGWPLALLAAAATACTPTAPPATTDAAAGTVHAAAETAAAAAAPPNLSGVWMAFAVENPDGGGNAPRYSAAGQAALDEFAAQFRSIPETGAWCVGTGMPSVMLSTVSYPIELVQNDSRIIMVAELETQVRRVFIDGRAHPDNFLPTSVGHSIGTWDGDTLVIETALLEEWQLRPWPRSGGARIVERVRLTKLADVSARPRGFVATDVAQEPINDDVLVFDITLTDPTYYDGPQRRIAYYQRMADTATLEYGCSKGLWFDQLEAQRISE